MNAEGRPTTERPAAAHTDMATVPPASAIARQAEAILDYWNAQLNVVRRLPDDVLADIAFLGCHDDLVAAAYRELDRRRAAA